jgi:hypothetical protein
VPALTLPTVGRVCTRITLITRFKKKKKNKKKIKIKILLMLVGVRREWGGRGTSHQTRRQVMALWHFGTLALWHYNPHNPHIFADQVGTKKR